MTELVRIRIPMTDAGLSDVTTWGAVDNGTATDDTTAFQACAEWCKERSKPVFVPATVAGFYISDDVRADHGAYGDGKWKSRIYVDDGVYCFKTSSVQSGDFHDMHFICAPGGVPGATPTGGAAILIDAPTDSAAAAPSVYNIASQNFWCGVQFQRVNSGKVFGNYISDFHWAGVQLANADHPDNGDYEVHSNTIDTRRPNAVGIRQFNSGGSKIWGNKFGGGVLAYDLSISGGVEASTTILQFHHNSCEHQVSGALRIARSGGATAQFGLVQIDFNEIAIPQSAGYIGVNIGPFVTNSHIIGNIIVAGSDGYCLYAEGPGLIIDLNTFIGQSGTSTGVALTPTSTGKLRGGNIFTGLNTNIADASGGGVVVEA